MDYVIESGLSSELQKLQHENVTLLITTYYIRKRSYLHLSLVAMATKLQW